MVDEKSVVWPILPSLRYGDRQSRIPKEAELCTTYGSFNLPDAQGPQQFLISGSPTVRYIRIYQLNGEGRAPLTFSRVCRLWQ
jgi:hypothetical protein